jgi:signal transduction histidine kinase/CheY-like chemotaxis protein
VPRGAAPGSAPPGSPSALLARVERDLNQIALDGLRPASLAVGILFTFFVLYNFVSSGPRVSVPMVSCNVAAAALGYILYWAARRFPLTTFGVHACSASLALAALGNIAAGALLHISKDFTLFLILLVVASAGSTPSVPLAVGFVVVETLVWLVIASRLLSSAERSDDIPVLVASVAVAFLVHATRRRARLAMQDLRRGDAEREEDLQRALAEAADARRELDRRVEERTSALRAELEERKRLEHQLRQAQKMDAVGRLAGGVAHDFNNLLTIIRMSIETLGDGGGLDADAQDALRDAADATNRAADLTRDLLAFGRKQMLNRVAVDVSDIVDGLDRMIRRVAPEGIKIEAAVDPEVGTISADSNQIGHVLLNLAINACGAMDGRGTLTVRADAVDLDPAHGGPPSLAKGAYVRIAVSDTGVGMDEEMMTSLFEPFFTTKKTGQGTGLGLAVAHGIVSQHGGLIDVASKVGAGSTFTVYLPRVSGSVPRLRVPSPRPAAPSGNGTILLVEDEPAVRRAVQRTLERLGYHVITARDADDALAIAQSVEGLDVLVTDVVMPIMDGPELARRIRAKRPSLPVLFLTGYSRDKLTQGGAVGPHDRVLQKPYQVPELASALEQILGRAGAPG